MGASGANRRSFLARTLRSPAILLHDLVTTLFPADCRCCEGPLLQASLVPVCQACMNRAAASAPLACWQCGEAIEHSLDLEDLRFAAQMAASLRCRECRMAEPAFDRAVSCGTYADELRTLIGLMKFDGISRLAKPLGDRLAEAILQLQEIAGPDLLVVAVPLSPGRRRHRGFNQSVLLADRALAQLRRTRPSWKLTPAHSTLKRVRQTEAQFELTARQRRRNLKGAFAVLENVSGREVLVIDDIMTTGATARECARVLKAAGAAKVWVATLARAQKAEFARYDEAREVSSWGSN